MYIDSALYNMYMLGDDEVVHGYESMYVVCNKKIRETTVTL